MINKLNKLMSTYQGSKIILPEIAFGINKCYLSVYYNGTKQYYRELDTEHLSADEIEDEITLWFLNVFVNYITEWK